uniref:Trypanosoma vivax n=1 Tax=Trypanosoma vivax (strain Y486) TaxID=1055687 RepID=G0U9Y8_TRYVY|nr:Trypanosoma vivax [Trypanosoma vivax Y486]
MFNSLTPSLFTITPGLFCSRTPRHTKHLMHGLLLAPSTPLLLLFSRVRRQKSHNFLTCLFLSLYFFSFPSLIFKSNLLYSLSYHLVTLAAARCQTVGQSGKVATERCCPCQLV